MTSLQQIRAAQIPETSYSLILHIAIVLIVVEFIIANMLLRELALLALFLTLGSKYFYRYLSIHAMMLTILFNYQVDNVAVAGIFSYFNFMRNHGHNQGKVTRPVVVRSTIKLE